jgi:hypothetical protein
MTNSPNQINPDNQTGEEKDRGQTQQVPPAETKKSVKATIASVFDDDLFKFFASISIVSWMIHEFVFDIHKVFLFIAIVFGLADAVYALAHKILKGWAWLILCWGLYAVCIFAIFKNEAQPTKEESLLRQPQ